MNICPLHVERCRKNQSKSTPVIWLRKSTTTTTHHHYHHHPPPTNCLTTPHVFFPSVRCDPFVINAMSLSYIVLDALPPSFAAACEGPDVEEENREENTQEGKQEDNKKDNAAKIGEAKCKLYLVGAEPDWKGGTIKNVSHPILSPSLKLVLSKARSSRAPA